MLNVELIRKNPEQVKAGIASKNADPSLVDKFLELDKEWRELTKKFDDLRTEQKKLGKEDKTEAIKIKNEIKKIEEKLSELEKLRQEVLYLMPNLPLPSVIIGKIPDENKVLREQGDKPNPPAGGFKDYLTLAQELDLIDTERAAKVSGSRFGYLKGGAALLEFALIDLAVKSLVKEGFVPIVPPVLINEKSMRGMGYLERGADEIYYFLKDNLYLVGTSEQSIGAMHQDEILNDLPKRYLGFSACFRREAGSYGKDTKGILRVHQFDKLEMFSIVEPQKSEAEHKFLLSLQEKLIRELKLPYRVLDICSGDLGDPAAAKYDIEVWLPGQNKGKGEYRETHSTSNTTDFQSRRLNVKYKNSQGKSELAHFINGTAFAIGRTIIAIIENYQTEKGTIMVPEVLQPYMGLKEIVKS